MTWTILPPRLDGVPFDTLVSSYGEM